MRKGGIYGDRETGNLAYAKFIHKTARPVDEKHLPDPHLHAHVYVFNNTFDEKEQKYKAAKVRNIIRDSGFYTASFQKSFADRLVNLGYRIKRTEKAFEIDGVPDAIIRHFSSRTNHIGQVAKEKGIVNAKAKDALGAKTRARKQKGLSMAELKTKWKEEISRVTKELVVDDTTHIRSTNYKKQEKTSNPRIYVDYALAHCFERASVVPEKKLMEAALKNAIGDINTTNSSIENELSRDNRILNVAQNGRRLATTKQILVEEQRMVDLATEGLNKIIPLYRSAPDIKLDGQQKAAIEYILTTSNRTTLVRGVAGSGKTTLMTEAIDLIKQSGKQVTVVAPTANASRGVLKEEGFANAETVAKLLQDKELQEKIEGQVIWCDEGGLLDTKSMTGLLELAKRKNAQLIIGGDTRQHSSVTRGDAMRILNVVGKLDTAEVSKIHRQRNFKYKDVVEDLSKGNVKDGFQKLDEMGHIISPSAENASEFWSLIILEHKIDSALFKKQGGLPNNFNTTLPKKLKPSAEQIFKDEYLLDFMGLNEQNDEKEIELGITSHIKDFILRMGKGFSFIGNQYRLELEGEEFFVDLLFFNRYLQCLVAFELKKGKFKPAYAGQLNFYLNVLDKQVRLPHENSSIGIVLCKEKNNTVVEYSVKSIDKAMGVATYKTTKQMPEVIKNLLPDTKTLADLL